MKFRLMFALFASFMLASLGHGQDASPTAITLQNRTSYTLDLYVDGSQVCQAGAWRTCTGYVQETPDTTGHYLEARFGDKIVKAADATKEQLQQSNYVWTVCDYTTRCE